MMLSVVVTGRVQGVGFRHFVFRNAADLNITGWVKNEPDGTVKAVFSGSQKDLRMMRDLCRKGPAFSRVIELKETWSTSGEQFHHFEIRR